MKCFIINLLKALWLVYVPSCLTLMNFSRAFSPQNAVMCLVRISEQTASAALCSCIRLLVYNRDGQCLLRGTNWVFESNRLTFGATTPSGPGPPHFRGFTIILRHTTHSIGLLWTSEQPDAGTSTWQHTQVTRDTLLRPPAGFEPAIPTRERSQTHALDRAATGIGP